MILKSPSNVFRANVLFDHYPRARFVWILRDPAELWTSNLKMWRAMIECYGLWKARGRELEEFLETALNSYATLLEDLHRDGCFRDQPVCSYEALANQPVTILPEMLDRLGLGPWSNLDASVQTRLLTRPKVTSAQREIPAVSPPQSLLLRIRRIHEAILFAAQCPSAAYN
jgi:hypothetical protein